MVDDIGKLIMQKIAVIGAGAAGLCAAKLLSKESIYEIVVYEATDHIGGTWFYTDDVDQNVSGISIHSSMYKNLRTKLPRQVMAFPEFKFKEELPSFLSHSDVLQYLQDFTAEFNLEKMISFNTMVEDVELLDEDQSDSAFPKFIVKSLNLQNNKTTIDVFDGLMVCNGHYHSPHTPNFPGKKDFQGKILHSHQYRTPSDFVEMDVVVLGAKASGVDISIEICKVAKSVKLSHRTPRLLTEFPPNLEQKPTVRKFGKNQVEFVDGTTTHCDVFIYCTGYQHSFPFFKTNKFVTINENRISPLYKDLIHISYPNLSFIGLHLQIFSQFHCQVSFAIKILQGKLKLPSKKEMIAEEQALSVSAARMITSKHWDYNNTLADLSGIPRIPDHIRLLYDLSTARRTANALGYREEELAITEH